MGMMLGLAQGVCPMCPGMGLWMALFWVVVLLLVVAVVWMLVRQ